MAEDKTARCDRCGEGVLTDVVHSWRVHGVDYYLCFHCRADIVEVWLTEHAEEISSQRAWRKS